MLPAVTSQEVLHVHATLVSQEMEGVAQVQNEFSDPVSKFNNSF